MNGAELVDLVGEVLGRRARLAVLAGAALLIVFAPRLFAAGVSWYVNQRAHTITNQMSHLLPTAAQPISPKTTRPHRLPLVTTQPAIHR